MPIRAVRLGFVGSLMIAALTCPRAAGGQTVDGPMALDELKQLAGRWEGRPRARTCRGASTSA